MYHVDAIARMICWTNNFYGTSKELVWRSDEKINITRITHVHIVANSAWTFPSHPTAAKHNLENREEIRGIWKWQGEEIEEFAYSPVISDNARAIKTWCCLSLCFLSLHCVSCFVYSQRNIRLSDLFKSIWFPFAHKVNTCYNFCSNTWYLMQL